MEPLTSTERPIVGLSLKRRPAGPTGDRRLPDHSGDPPSDAAAVLGFAATVVAFIGWFAALFTGRLPDGMADFLGRIVQYSTRVYAYLYLLTDTYPPFGLEATAYPISVVLPPRGSSTGPPSCSLHPRHPRGDRGRGGRSGLQVVLLVVWLITLVAGRLPRSAFEAAAAALRYETRFYAWFLMLTSEYPHALFGDPGLAAPGPDYSPPPPAPGTIPPPPPLPGAAAPAPEPPRITALVLSKPGRRLLVTTIVLGVLFLVAQIVVSIVAAATSSESLRDVDDAYDEVLEASQDYGSPCSRAP